MIKKIFKIIMWIVIILALIVILFLAYSTLTDYQPKAEECISVSEKPDTISIEQSFRILTWNIGYAGLNKEMDFFYDGGKQVRPLEEQVRKNMDEIAFFLSDSAADFMMLQEVDEDAKRSYYKNQVEYFDGILPDYHCFFAMNYNVRFVPLPVTDPVGKVKAGVATYSVLSPDAAERHSFPFNFSWPLKVFMLDRCFLLMRFPTSNHKELVLINTHNSAFDEDGKLRKAELSYFRNFLMDEYKKGNYVVAGGDFNQCPLHVVPKFNGQPFDFSDYHVVPDTLLPPDWRFKFDNSVPSNRRTDMPYEKGVTKVSLIDFFIVSPNVEMDSVKCVDLGFEHSDHNPVKAVFRLKGDKPAD